MSPPQPPQVANGHTRGYLDIACGTHREQRGSLQGEGWKAGTQYCLPFVAGWPITCLVSQGGFGSLAADVPGDMYSLSCDAGALA